MTWPRRRRWQETDQDASAADQTGADADQTASDTDQSASDRDQALADADQRASDRDQAASNRDWASQPEVDPAGQRAHERSRGERATGTLDRHAGAKVRAQVSTERHEQAGRRDDIALERDRVADERDRVSAELDQESERLAEELDSSDLPVARALDALAAAREKTALLRAQAAADRERAARDREAAGEDRQNLLADVEHAHLDELTGAYRRGMGEIALVNELQRAQRSSRALVLAFVDFDGLKKVNDREGHAAGDALLRDLVALLRSNLRPYDPIVRWGGDEFVCAISDSDLENARGRFEEIREGLAKSHPRASVSFGLATQREGDTLEALLERADAALLEGRRRP